jgi:hypothetical protein
LAASLATCLCPHQESKRGVGLQFGPDITKKFLDDNGLKLVVRSHEVSHTALFVDLMSSVDLILRQGF